jgi:Fur family transcriptional regulator, peroxide stress response regulator
MSIRLTKKRQSILDFLKQQRRALSAKEIHEALYDIDLVTIYRNLELFAKEKLVAVLHLHGHEARYEYRTEPHHHAVCNQCEKIIHFTAPNEEIKRLLGLSDFEIEEIDVTVRGVCHKREHKI